MKQTCVKREKNYESCIKIHTFTESRLLTLRFEFFITEVLINRFAVSIPVPSTQYPASQPPTSDFGHPTSDTRLRTPDFGHPTLMCLLRIQEFIPGLFDEFPIPLLAVTGLLEFWILFPGNRCFNIPIHIAREKKTI